MYIGGVFTVKGGSAIWHETLNFSKGLVASGMYAVLFATLALLVASLAGRRAVAAAMIVALFIVTTPVLGVMMGLAYSGSVDGELTGGRLQLSQLAPLVSPMTLVDGVSQWWFEAKPIVGQYGPLYGLVTLGLIVVAAVLLLLRYRKVAR
jgi:ABC-2 type transport system permease protein